MHADRKRDHLRICADKDTRSGLSTGLETYQLVHCALPELSLDAIDTATPFLGRPLSAPLLISAMTGGVPDALEINRNLARAAQALGVAMGLGSQRAGLDTPDLMSTYQVRDVAPDILLLANLGAVQLVHGHGVDDCRRIVDVIEADALVLHLNPLQEALQPEGDTDFRGLLDGIAAVCSALPVPVIVKEVGWGISAVVAERLHQAGVAAIDVSGAGGTSWSKVEGQRAATSQAFEVTCAFDDWGLPTAEALVAVRERAPASAPHCQRRHPRRRAGCQMPGPGRAARRHGPRSAGARARLCRGRRASVDHRAAPTTHRHVLHGLHRSGGPRRFTNHHEDALADVHARPIRLHRGHRSGTP